MDPEVPRTTSHLSTRLCHQQGPGRAGMSYRYSQMPPLPQEAWGDGGQSRGIGPQEQPGGDREEALSRTNPPVNFQTGGVCLG